MPPATAAAAAASVVTVADKLCVLRATITYWRRSTSASFTSRAHCARPSCWTWATTCSRSTRCVTAANARTSWTMCARRHVRRRRRRLQYPRPRRHLPRRPRHNSCRVWTVTTIAIITSIVVNSTHMPSSRIPHHRRRRRHKERSRVNSAIDDSSSVRCALASTSTSWTSLTIWSRYTDWSSASDVSRYSSSYANSRSSTLSGAQRRRPHQPMSPCRCRHRK